MAQGLPPKRDFWGCGRLGPHPPGAHRIGRVTGDNCLALTLSEYEAPSWGQCRDARPPKWPTSQRKNASPSVRRPKLPTPRTRFSPKAPPRWRCQTQASRRRVEPSACRRLRLDRRRAPFVLQTRTRCGGRVGTGEGAMGGPRPPGPAVTIREGPCPPPRRGQAKNGGMIG